MNILLSTFGATYEIIPETLGLFRSDYGYDYYADKGEKTTNAVKEARNDLKDCRIHTIDELWLLATDQSNIDETAEKLDSWISEYSIVKEIRFFILKDIHDIASKQQADAFHNMAIKVTALAKKLTQKSSGKLLISLAGGRKTMSSDMQDAAYSFGFSALMHILSAEDYSIIPTVLAKDVPGNEVLQDLFDDSNTWHLEKKNFILSSPLDYLEKVKQRLKESRCFYSTLYATNNLEDSREMFPALYTLSSDMRQKLKDCKIGFSPKTREIELSILRDLPKADLHCHLGGVLQTSELIEVAEVLEDEIVAEEKKNDRFSKWLKTLDIHSFKNPCFIDDSGNKNWNGWKNWRDNIKQETGAAPSLIVAAFLLKFKGNSNQLDEILYGEKRIEKNYSSTAKFNRTEKGELSLAEYAAYGDLQGSSLLQSEKAIRKTVQILLRDSKKENLKYLEIRCSPINYTKENRLSAKQVVTAIIEELEKGKKSIVSSILFIASRLDSERKDKISEKSREIMVQYKNLIDEMSSDSQFGDLFNHYFRGFDLAGDEKTGSPKQAAEIFEDALKACADVTIHAGETMAVENIWEAVYKLNAERIGHGLTLKDDSNLKKKFLERRIGIEMCPSSNYQIVGFKDNYYPDQWENEFLFEDYPLKDYLNQELRVCINTDDPGISRTNITNEYLKAGRLTKGGLSLWDLLLLCYNGFALAFYPYNEKKQLIANMNKLIYEWIKNQNQNIDHLIEAQNEK